LVFRIEAVAWKVADVEPAATETEDGAERTTVLLSVMETVAPPDGAAALNLTVHVEVAPESMVVGEQLNAAMVGGALTGAVTVTAVVTDFEL
jgi:hypothetical protein